MTLALDLHVPGLPHSRETPSTTRLLEIAHCFLLDLRFCLTPSHKLTGSQLADRVAALEAEKAVLLQKQQQTLQAPPEPQPSSFTSAFRAATRSPRHFSQNDSHAGASGASLSGTATPAGAATADSSTTPTNAAVSDTTAGGGDAAQARLQLAEALRSKGQLQTKLRAAEDELRKLRGSTQVATKQVHDLKTERNALQGKLRDRNEELEAKTKAFLVCPSFAGSHVPGL